MNRMEELAKIVTQNGVCRRIIDGGHQYAQRVIKIAAADVEIIDLASPSPPSAIQPKSSR
jgi:hypothetical protein